MSKSSSKPSISSSPNRAEKFQPPPPPLTRLLRTNVANRSRSRSLSSPMFPSSIVRKKKADIETQEPSSPKVTCIGQVRVRRSSKQPPAPPKPKPTKQPRSCRWLKRVLFCTCFSRKPTKPRHYNPFWHRCFPSYHHRKNPHLPEDSSRRDFKPRIEEEEEGEEKQASEAATAIAEEESGGFAPSTPPKNALLLMRCRSAPHRSENRLGVVSLSLSPESTVKKEAQREEEDDEEDEEKVAQLGASSRPLILTRCKSEPASRTGSKVDLIDRCESHVFFD